MEKIWFKWLMVIAVMVSSVMSFPFGEDIAFAKDASGAGKPFTITGILGHDTIKSGQPHLEPKSYEEVSDLIINKPEHRTGWSGATFSCDLSKDYDEMGKEAPPGVKTGLHWKQELRDNTDSAGRDHNYNVADYKKEIVAAYGEEVYQAALESGKPLKADSVTKYTIYKHDSRNDTPCNAKNPNTKAYYYNNQDFFLSMTFNFEASSVNKGESIIEGGEACEAQPWHITVQEELYREQEQTKCRSVGVVPNSIGHVQWELYKPNSNAISSIEVDNKIEKDPESSETVDEKERHVVKDGTMIWHTRAPGVPESKVKHVGTSPPAPISPLVADIMKGSQVNYDFEYQFTNAWEEQWFKSGTRERIYSTSCSTDSEGNTSCYTYHSGYTSWSDTEPKKIKDEPDWSKTELYEKNMTLDVKHERGELENMGEDKTNKEMEIGRHKEVPSPEKETIAKEILEMDVREMQAKKTQTTFEYVKNPLKYTTKNDGFKNHAVQFYNIQPKFEYYPVDMDVNIRNKYTNYGSQHSSNPYVVRLKMDKSNPASMKLTSEDAFYTTYDTGLLFSVDGGGGDAESVAASEYTGFTGANYRDKVFNTDQVYKTSYYIPIDGNNTNMKPREKYINDFVISKLGYNDYTLEFKQGFSFNRYLLGSVVDDTWVVEQHDPIAEVTYAHSVNITPEKGAKVKQEFNDRTMLLHDYRITDGKDFFDKVKNIIGF